MRVLRFWPLLQLSPRRSGPGLSRLAPPQAKPAPARSVSEHFALCLA